MYGDSLIDYNATNTGSVGSQQVYQSIIHVVTILRIAHVLPMKSFLVAIRKSYANRQEF